MKARNVPYLCLAMSAVLAGPAARASAAPMRASTVEGKSIEGAWLGVDAGKIKLSVEGRVMLLDPAALMGLHGLRTTTQPASATSRPADEVVVTLADGGRFPARIVASSGESLRLETQVVPELELKLTALAALAFQVEEPSAAAKALAEALAHREATQDALITLQDGKVNVLRGTLESLDGRGLKFNWRSRSVAVDRSRVFALVLATGAGPEPAPQARCMLSNGQVWAGRLLGGNEQSLELELTAGPTVRMDIDLVADIRLRNEHLVFLSDLEPSSYEFTPWGTTRWPYRKDRSVANRPMRIGGEVFDRGIGVHSASKLTYALGEPARQFAATIGIDDAVGSRGNVVFRVLADGRELFDSGPVTGRDEPRPVLVDLGAAKTLQLVVDFGGELDIGDQANWANARLIR